MLYPPGSRQPGNVWVGAVVMNVPEPTCPIFTTQYLQSSSVTIGFGGVIILSLYTDSGLTTPTNAICDYVVSGTFINAGYEYNFSRTILSGSSSFSGFTGTGPITDVITTSVIPSCGCVNVIPVIPPTPTPTPTSTNTPTPSVTATITPSVTPTNTVTPTITPTNTVTPTSTLTPTPTPSSSPIPSGTTEANTFLSAVAAAGGTLSPTISAATRTLFTSLVSNNLWDKLSTFYPMIGETQASCKFNGKNPLDTDAAFRLTYAGGINTNSDGLIFNGTNSFADTYWNPNTNLPTTSGHISIYVKTITGTGGWLGVNAGGTPNRFYMGNAGAFNSINSNAEQSFPGTATGFSVMTRTGTTNVQIYNDGVYNSYADASTSNPSLNAVIGGRNNNGTASNFTNFTINWTSFGQGLNQTESVALTNIITTFQTTLGRN